MAKVSTTLDMMFGSHLDAHIMGNFNFYQHYSSVASQLNALYTLGGYEFLMQNC